MSFVWKRPEGRLRTPEQIASIALEVSRKRGLNDFAAVLTIMAVAQESDFWNPWNRKDPSSQKYSYDSESNDGRSVGGLQQQNGAPGEDLGASRNNWWGPMASRMDPARSMDIFMDRLPDEYMNGAASPAAASEMISRVQSPRPDLRQAYAKHWDRAWSLVRGAAAQLGATPIAEPAPAAPVPPPTQESAAVTLTDPFTGAVWSPNRYHPRGLPAPRWIAIHTQEGGRSADGLAAFLADPNSQVSYHAINDDKKLLKIVAEEDAPWAAAGANKYAFHLCLAGSYSAWSRGKWLETDASDGTNEDLELTDAAKIVAWWCLKYNIPCEWIGGNGIPWGKEGICGHVDFGAWGGGHHDPGLNFPVDELIRRAKAFIAGAPVPAPVINVPIGPAGGPPVDPQTSPYFTGLLYQGVRGQDAQVRELQRRLSAAYSSYAGHLPVDGDFGPLTDAAVREFQRRSGLHDDGIVGTQTAAALKLKKV